MQEKILVGHKLRRFRQSAGLSQTAMAEALDISPSYLNLLEHLHHFVFFDLACPL